MKKFFKFCAFTIIVLSACAIMVRLAKMSSNLKAQLCLKEHNKEFFYNLEEEKMSVLKTDSFPNRSIKDNADVLAEIGPIPEGKFISSFSDTVSSSYTTQEPYGEYYDWCGNCYTQYREVQHPYTFHYVLTVLDISDKSAHSIEEYNALVDSFATELTAYRTKLFHPAEKKLRSES